MKKKNSIKYEFKALEEVELGEKVINWGLQSVLERTGKTSQNGELGVKAYCRDGTFVSEFFVKPYYPCRVDEGIQKEIMSSYEAFFKGERPSRRQLEGGIVKVTRLEKKLKTLIKWRGDWDERYATALKKGDKKEAKRIKDEEFPYNEEAQEKVKALIAKASSNGKVIAKKKFKVKVESE